MTAFRSMLSLALAGALLATAACTAKEDVQDDFSDLAGMDEKSDAFSYRMKIVGSLSYGETSDTVIYTSLPRYRAFKFAGDPGDQVVVDVKATGSGDPVAWVLDDSFRVLAVNDDAGYDTLDSHLEVTLTANADPEIRTYYIVFRDYWLQRRSFQVSLAGPAQDDFRSCNFDSDCAKILDGCCRLSWGAVRADSVDAYYASLGCPEDLFCPAVVPSPTDDVAICDNSVNQCVLVTPEVMPCGGHVINHHDCPAGWECVGEGLPVDIPGQCRKLCGGFANFPCTDGATCVDDWRDDCDPNDGGADCSGLCLPETCGGFGNLACPDGFTCADDTTDSCDIGSGGADCGGICVR